MSNRPSAGLVYGFKMSLCDIDDDSIDSGLDCGWIHSADCLEGDDVVIGVSVHRTDEYANVEPVSVETPPQEELNAWIESQGIDAQPSSWFLISYWD